MKEKGSLPGKVIKRLYIYYRTLREYKERLVSSKSLSQITGFSPEIIRKDLNVLGKLGIRGRGYSLEILKKNLNSILRADKKRTLALVGAGNIGKALIAYKGFPQRGFFIKHVFDKDPAKINKTIGKIVIKDRGILKETLKRHPVDIGIVAVPKEEAQEAIDSLIACGIKYILNFAPINPKKIPNTYIHNVELSLELERLSFNIT